MDVILNRGAIFASLLRSTVPFLAADSPISVRCICCINTNRWNHNLFDRRLHYRPVTNNYLSLSNYISKQHRTVVGKNDVPVVYYSKNEQLPKEDCPPKEKKVSIFQKMKQLTKDYWYILIPVHIVTSLGWVAIFYTAAKNGVDIVGIMESVHLSEKYLDLLRNSSAGNWAITYALYKLFTPLRYTVTIGGTTMCIRHLNKLGYLKASSFKGATGMTRTEACATEHKTKFKGSEETEPPKS